MAEYEFGGERKNQPNYRFNKDVEVIVQRNFLQKFFDMLKTMLEGQEPQQKLTQKEEKILEIQEQQKEKDLKQKTLLEQQQNELQLKKELSDKFGNYIDKKEEFKIVYLLEKGYQINESECFKILIMNSSHDTIINETTQFLQKNFSHVLGKNLFNIKSFEEWSFESGYDDYLIDDDHITEYDSWNGEWKPSYNYEDDSYISEEYKREIKQEILSILKKFNTYLKNTNNDYNKIFENNTQQEQVKTLHSIQRFLKITEKIKYSGREDFENKLNTIKDFLQQENKDFMEDEFKKEMGKYSNILSGFDSMKNNIVSGIVGNLKNFRESQLPQEARELITQIRDLSLNINKEELNQESVLEFSNLYDKRFPQVIEEFITISPYYKDKLKQHNENPETLLVDSLKELSQKIQNIQEGVDNGKYTKMQVTNRYLKSKP